MPYPVAPREALVEDLHGHRVADPYRWLEDDEDARTRVFVEEQDEYFRAVRETWPNLNEWHRAVADHAEARSITPPVARGSRRFVLTHDTDAGAPVLLVDDVDGGTHQEFDLGSLSTGGRNVVRGFRPSWEGDRLVCMISADGGDRVTHHVLDTVTGAQVEPPSSQLPAAWVAWLPGGEAFYYVGFSDVSTGPTDLVVRLHRIGTASAADPVVFPTGGASSGYLGLTIDPAGRWLAVTVSRGVSSRNALWLASLHLDASAPRWRQVTDEAFGATVAPRFGHDGRLYLMTDHRAPRGRVWFADPALPEPEHWREGVPEDAEAVLDDCVPLDGLAAPSVLALHTRHGVSELSVHDPGRTTPPRPVRLPGAGVVSSLRGNPDGGGEAWMVYSDFITPPTIYRFDARSHALTRMPSPEYRRPPRASDAARSRRVAYTADDGTVVRMFLLTPDRGAPGPRPTIVSGYGGFGVPLRPVYSPVILAWLAAGGQYALVCVRGGGEGGTSWHHAGRGRNKKTAVTDFIAATEWLVRNRWTDPGMLAAAGASHGGFLVAAAAMRRPDLFTAVLCADPLLDMVRYEHLGVGATWTEEFGSSSDPSELKHLLEISPYHQVREGTVYPAVLFSGGTHDPRLGAAHVRKMCAALQYATGEKSPALMRLEAGVGHGSRTPSQVLELNGDTLSFLAAHTGLRPPRQPSEALHRTRETHCAREGRRGECTPDR